MKCLKCGKAVSGLSEFCEECLADMSQHPVKPDTPVVLPKRENILPVKHSRKRALKPEQQLQSLRLMIRLLIALVILLSVSLIVCIVVLLEKMGTPVTSLLPVSFP